VIEVRHLRYFVAVSEEFHFGRAAERLHITQPPLSQAIRKLEDELGVELLRRTSRTVVLTDAGRVFAAEARKVVASFDRALIEARRAAGAGATLHIGCVPHLPVERLLTFLSELRRHEPNLSIQVRHLLTIDQVRRLRDGELDIGIFPRAGAHNDLELQRLFPGEPLSAFLPPDHPLAAKPVLTPEDIRGEPLVMFPRAADPTLHDMLIKSFEDAGFRFTEVHEAGGPSASEVLLAVASGAGIALALTSMRHTSDAGRIVVQRPLEPQLQAPETVVAWVANQHGTVQAIVDALRVVARDLSTVVDTTDDGSAS
jgi:DNA-binding transcriptional LysR family regulator